MKTSVTIVSILIVLILSSCSTISVSKIEATGSITPKGNGIVYCLPKTLLHVKVTVQKTIKTPSPVYLKEKQMIDKLINDLGLLDLAPISEKETSCKITSIQISPVTVEDENQLYFAEFRRTNALFVKRQEHFLLEDGKFLGEGSFSYEDETVDAAIIIAGEVIRTASGIPSLAFTQSNEGTSDQSYGSLVLKRISEIRGIRNDLLNGELESKIYNSDISLILKKLDEEEKQLILLICGTSEIVSEKQTFIIDPQEGETTLFYFRKSDGILLNKTNDATPVILKIPANVIRSQTDKQISENEKQTKSRNRGIYYRIPFNTRIQILNGQELIAEEPVIIPQLGSVAFLPSKVSFFASTVSFEIDPKTGGLKKLETEGKGLKTETIKNATDVINSVPENRISDLENRIKLIELQQKINELSEKESN